MSKEDVKIPKSKEDVLNPANETVDAAPNSGCVVEAAPTVDAGKDSGVGHFEGNGQDVKFVSEK